MQIVVQGSKTFNDYAVFLRAMSVAMSDLTNDTFNVYTVGAVNINRFTAEFVNKIEGSLRQRGIKARYFKVPASYIEEHMDEFDYFAYFCDEGQRPSDLFLDAEVAEIETAIFRY